VEFLRASNVSIAWLAAAKSLLERSKVKAGREAWDLAVEILDPASEVSTIRAGLDEQLAGQELQSIDTVANTIFPQSLWRSSRSREEFFDRYRRMVPKLKKFRVNSRGLYFDRLTEWPPGGAEPINQVEAVIKRITSERQGRGPLRFVYDMSVFSPRHDKRPMGFPCLAYLNVKLDGDRLRLTSHYRNHYFVERAYGNYIGLARLQEFIAGETGLGLGPLTCISGHAALEPEHARTEFLLWLRQVIEEHQAECD
jgi:thymidylate synthase